MIGQKKIPFSRIHANPILIRPKRIVFFTILILAFLFSGLITILHVVPYRMGLTTILIVPLVFFYGLRISRVLIAYTILAILIGLSAFVNSSSLSDLIIFLRILGFSYLIYFLVELFVNENNITSIIKFCVFIAVIQLPIIIFQQVFYSSLPTRVTQGIVQIDFDFGTFNANDAPLSIFLAFIVIFLLFDKKHNHIFRYKWPIALWLTLTILIVNAELVKIIIVLVWGVYLFRFMNIKILFSVLSVFIVIILILSMAGILNQIWADFYYSFSQNIRTGELQEEAFLSGAYSRGAAISYYLRQNIIWFGDGPSKYYNVFSNVSSRGNTGHIFTFYSEVGLLSVLTSFLIFFLIAFPGSGWRIRRSWVGLLIFGSIILLSFTTEVMNDISIFLIYAIIAKTYLIPPLKQSEFQPSNS